VEHGMTPLLIVAGAGTGKTTTIAHRVSHLISQGIDPARILLLTFTRRASQEMLRRVESILETGWKKETTNFIRPRRKMAGKIRGGTFHSVATGLLRKYGKFIGLRGDFTILDRGDSADLINVLRTELKLSDAETRFPLKRTCQEIYSHCLNAQKKLEPVLVESYTSYLEHIDNLRELFQLYMDRKEEQSVLDYDDLLVFWDALLQDETGGKTIRALFDCVLVDEYQDTNVLQAEILKKLSPTGSGLTVVGDDAQSIYSFRAATVRNILDFPKTYANASIIPLEQNYRSTQPILNMANAVIEAAKEKHRKKLWSTREDGSRPVLLDCYDENEQTEFIVQKILQQREDGIPLSHQAVLFRASHHSMNLELELSQRDIPFHKYGGLKFLETAHLKDLIAFLKLMENPRDLVSGIRILTLFPGIGPKKATSLMARLSENRGSWNAWREFSPPVDSKKRWTEFLKLIDRLSAKSKHSKADTMAEDVRAVRLFYIPLMKLKLDYPQSRMRDLEQLEQIAERFKSRQSFLTELTLDPPTSTQDFSTSADDKDDFLVLSTIHSAKGLEWDTVFVLNASDGHIPSSQSFDSNESLEEERRLFYVALTRAQNRLFVCLPQRSFTAHWKQADRYGLALPSRFLTKKVIKQIQRQSFLEHPQEDGSYSDKSGLQSSKSIRQRLKNAFL